MKLALQPSRRKPHAKPAPPHLSVSPHRSCVKLGVVTPFRINTCESVSKQRTLTGSVDILGTEGGFSADRPGGMMFSTQAGGGMPEIGLLPFARVALDVATTVLPTYRSRFSKHQFTQPQLLAILCLMRYEDWTFREAEVRL